MAATVAVVGLAILLRHSVPEPDETVSTGETAAV